MANDLVLGRLSFDTSAQDRQVAEAKTKLNRIKDSDVTRETVAMYQRLRKAQAEYIAAFKSGDAANQAYWGKQISQQREYLQFTKSIIGELGVSATAQKKITQTINDSEAAYRRYERTVASVTQARKDAEDRARAQLQKENDAAARAAQQAAEKLRREQEAEQARMQAAVQASATKDKNAKDAAIVRDIANAYKELTAAQSAYLSALKGKDQSGAAVHQEEIKHAQEMLDMHAKSLEAYNLDADAKHKAQEILYSSITAEDKYQETLTQTKHALEEKARAEKEAADAKKAAQDQKQAAQDEKNDLAQLKAQASALKTAQSEYVAAIKGGNGGEVNYWENEIERIKKAIEWQQHYIHLKYSSDDTNEAADKIVERVANSEGKVAANASKAQAALHKQPQEISDSEKQMKQLVAQAERWLATMVVMRGLKNLWNNAKEYASQYYDAMNEIRIVTMMSQEEADTLGARYRQMAQDMSVSSTEIAKAAVEYWRQGLDSQKVESRLQYTTMYAKISAMDFEEAAELMTAATNAMGLTADRVADVWAYLGDASASGADEIGTAMQKIAAVAESAGIKFEWLGAYIATLSEKTRMAPEAIGTALNSIISRLQQIKEKGFNSEDIYGVNDIAKALGSLEQPIALMDEATGKWRDFPAILNDIAAQWQNLTDKEKAYIATTMGGTRQRNYLLTLLDDLSGAAEGGSRAWELYEGAQNAAGTAMEKYSIWEESVEAAQGRFNAQMEELYSILNGETLKGFYDALAVIVGWINDAAAATEGWNVKAGLAVGGLTLLALVIRNVVIGFASMTTASAAAATGAAATGVAATAAAGGISMMNIALMATAAGIVITGIVTVVGLLGNLGMNAEEAAKKTKELGETLSGARDDSKGIRDSIAEIEGLRAAYTGTEKDVADFNTARASLIAKYPALKGVLQDEIKTVGELAGAYAETVEYLEKLNAAQIRANYRTAHEGIGTAETTYNNARWKITGQTQQSPLADNSLKKLSGEMNNGLTLADPESFLRWDNEWNDIRNQNVYDEFVRLYQQNIDMISAYIANAQGEVDQKYFDALDAWTEALYGRLLPNRDEQVTDAGDQMQDALETILTDAQNPYKLSGMVKDIPSLVELLLGEEWTNEYGLPMTVDEIRKKVDDIVPLYTDAVESAKAKIAQAVALENAGNLGSDADFIIDSLLGSLRGAYVPEDKIIEIMEPLFTAMSIARDEMLERLFGSPDGADGGGGTGSANPNEKPFEDKLKAALEYVERIENLQEIITEAVENGGLTAELWDGLTNLFSPEMLEEMLANATDAVGELDIEAFIQALRDKLTEWQEKYEGDPENNLMLSALGLTEDTPAKVEEAMKAIAEATSVDELAKVWEGLPQKVKDAIGDTGKEIEELIASAADDSENAADKVEDAMERIRRSMKLDDMISSNKVWEDLDDIVSDLTSSLDTAMGAVGDIADRMNEAGVAAGALEAAALGDTDALDYLANLTGLTADMLANDLSPAEYLVSEMGDQASASLSYLADWLYQVGAINIDASGKIVPIQSIEAAADACGMTVAALANALALFNGSSLTWTRTSNGLGLKAQARVPSIKWTGGSSSSKKKSSGSGGGGRSGGGGGGGGGGSSNDVSELVETLVDEFSKLNELRDHRRELAQLGQSYHEARGEIQGVIAYLQIERDVVEENVASLRNYLTSLEAQIEANRAIVTSEKEGSKAYNQAMIDLDKLQEEHQKYSQELIKNETDVQKLTDAIKEQYDKIRQMEIDLRNTILEAIEDREAAEERKLSGRIEMEDKILDAIRKRYEAERDEIITTQEARRDALEEEIDQIDELLEARKKLAEQEDKMAEIAELEAQIQRISADPTRQKEALQLREKLAKLREDMAWEAAESEAEAQKKSIQQQITSIEDYIAYVQEYYDDLFKHPQKLIEEMQEILTWTDDQIIAWLKKNSEGYADSTAATQRKMEQEWQATLDDMRDTIRTHWDEVESIIAGGAENIINFLTTYSQKYREAGKLQAEAYVDEWRKQLTDLENAYKQVNANIAVYDYVQTQKVSSSGGSGGGGGGYGGGSGGAGSAATSNPVGKAASAMNDMTTKGLYRFKWLNSSGTWVAAYTALSIAQALDNAKKAALAHWSGINSAEARRAMADINSANISQYGSYIKKYASGGLSMNTGLAWLDGTPQRPERILNAHQTELFEDMIATLHAIRRVNTGGILSAPRLSDSRVLPNIDTINITVEQLNEDADYEEGAEKLMNAFYSKISRVRPVGGIQDW